MKISSFCGSFGLLVAMGTVPAFAQDDVPPGLQCLRYLQGAERSLHVPQGLLTAISLVETGRPTDKSERLIPWPWTDLTDILDQRDRDYCTIVLRSRWSISGADVCGAGGR